MSDTGEEMGGREWVGRGDERNGEGERRIEQTSVDIRLALLCSAGGRIEPRRSTSGRCQTDARVVLDRALAHNLCSPGGHLDGRAALRGSRDARYGGRR